MGHFSASQAILFKLSSFLNKMLLHFLKYEELMLKSFEFGEEDLTTQLIGDSEGISPSPTLVRLTS
jgi:hypothetical protein